VGFSFQQAIRKENEMTITRPAPTVHADQTKGTAKAIAAITTQAFSGQAATLDLEELRIRITGDVITAGHTLYDEARKTQAIDVDRHPLAIVRALNAGDVAEAVRFARDHDHPLSVRSGGHSVPRLNVINDAIVVDLSQMKSIVIDPDRRTARVQPGVTSGDFGPAANEHGLALSTGDTSSVGIGGLATGGGLGFMARKYGLAIDNLLSARVVTADGNIVTASPNENADLFWAIRGGGGNFGIVTEFEFRLAPVKDVLAGMILLPATREAVRGYLEYSASAPDDLTTLANLMHAPPAPFVPEDRVGEPVLGVLVIWTGIYEDGERALAPLRALGVPVADFVARMPYPAVYDFTAHQAQPHGFSLRSMYADDLSNQSIDLMLSALKNATSPYSVIHLRGLGGAFARVADDETAYPNRARRYFFAAIAVWLDPEENADIHRTWVEAIWQGVRQEGSGVYVNFLDNEGEARIREAYGEANYARLARIKAKYDPDNFFRFNQNIRPQS
jgi:FAD/FMN-containing dehydrogenase